MSADSARLRRPKRAEFEKFVREELKFQREQMSRINETLDTILRTMKLDEEQEGESEGLVASG